MTTARVAVDPGNCGFLCAIGAENLSAKRLKISMQSECPRVQRLADLVGEVDLAELFAPMIRNHIFVSAETAHCHTSCLVPLCMVKAAEVALGLAVPQDVSIRFATCREE